jgi:nucleotide-binding universal stress UspA family protein
VTSGPLQLETIVVGYDGTAQAERALEYAAALAAVFDAKLVVTTVVPPAGGVSSRPGAGELDRARAILAGRPLDVEYQSAIGDAADAIVEVAALRDADLIVLGTRSPGAVERLLGHSVSHRVLRDARCNLLVVRR